MRVLVTGGAGYLGSVLVPKLLARGHSVRVLDLGYFGLGHLRGLRPAIELVREDLRAVVASPAALRDCLVGCDCVIHLAAVSNVPSAELNPALTDEVTFLATQVLKGASRQGAVKVFGTGQQWRPFLEWSACAGAPGRFPECREPAHVCYTVAQENMRMVAAAKLFERMTPALVTRHVDAMDDDRRDYRVST